MRLGVCSGPKPVLDRLSLHMQASVMHASGLSQVNLGRNFTNNWKFKCFVCVFHRMRLGVCSGPKPLIDRLSMHMQVSSVHASGLSQIKQGT